jgi:multicomponent Na+:H+ antiporter subunit B
MRRGFGGIVLNLAFRLLLPFIIVFAVAVLVHGHYSPGGGFQAGALLGVAVILVQLVQGQDAKWVGRRDAVTLSCIGALIYLGIGTLSFFWGGNFLDYGVIPWEATAAKARALGILGIEVGVTLAVMGVTIIMFDSLTRERGEE